MGINLSNWHWCLRVASFLTIFALDTIVSDCTKAQIVPDSTLGAESSLLTPNVSIDGLPADQIDGGARQGANLFHSFQQFNVGDGQRVLFANPGGIENIFTRVTGTNPSTILGTLGVNGGANLFLLNPNGIIFGPNARLDLRGSFLASTARSIKFADGREFSALNPSAAPLLTLNVPIGLQYGQDTGRILVQGQGNELSINQQTGEILEFTRTGGLEVETGQTLALAGGEVILEGGSLSAESGRVEIWGIQGEGLVGITATNPGWELTNQSVQNFQDIRLSQTAAINTSGAGGGKIQIQGRRITLEDGSLILSLTEGEGSGGNISIRSAESVQARGTAANGEASLFLTEALGIGRAGNVEINTASLILQDGAQVSSSTFNQGSGGKIIVNASEFVTATGIAATGNFASGLFSVTNNTGEGGTVEVTTKRLLLEDGAQISATTFSQGRGGNAIIKAAESVAAIGIAPIGPSGLFAASEGTGEGGKVEINTAKLILQNGAQVSATAFSAGNGGDVLVNASESVTAIGIAQNGSLASGLGAQTQGTGEGGKVEINTAKLILQDGAQISATAFSEGKGGDVLINALDSVEVLDIDQNNTIASSLIALTRSRGDGGRVEINTKNMSIQAGGQVSAATTNQGKGGDILVNASDSVAVIGVSANGSFMSSLRAQTQGTGNGGTVTVNTERLIIQDGARITTTTFNQGQAGNVIVNAAESVETIGFGSGIRVQTQGAGDGGTLTVNTKRFLASKGAQNLAIAANNSTGNGGNINIQADEVALLGTSNNGEPTIVFATTRGNGRGGEIRIETDRLILQEGAQIGAGTFSSGRGGDVFVKAADTVEIFGSVPQLTNRDFFRDQSGQRFPSGLFTGSENTGFAGNLKIETETLRLRDKAAISVNNQGVGDAGSLAVVARNLLLDNQAVLSATTKSGQGGNIALQIDDLLLLRRNSQISTTAGIEQAGGDGGNILIDSGLIVAIANENSDITANAYQGRGGNINITTQGIFGLEFRNDLTAFSDITVSSEFGLAGIFEIDILDVDPGQGLTELPADIIDVSSLIEQDFCRVVGKDSAFIVSGRGGLPSSPNEPLRANAPWEDLRLVEETQAVSQLPPVFRSEQPNIKDGQPRRIVEAQAWITAPNGNVLLTAEPVAVTPQGLWLHPLDCQLWKQKS